MRSRVLVFLLAAPVLASVGRAHPAPQSAPYPQSTAITGITWDSKSNITRQATGSDNWPTTWADDGDLYTAYGDGWGFIPKVPIKLSLGFCKVSGSPPNQAGTNIRSATGEDTGGGRSGKKCSGILMVNGTLYMWVRNANKSGLHCQLAWSTDHAKTWNWGFTFTEFGYCTFINYGKNYSGARDNYVYTVTHDSPDAYVSVDSFILMRVPKGQIKTRSAYEFFTGLDGNGNPKWSSSVSQRKPVFTNPGRCNRSGISYNAGLGRYLWWQGHPGDTRFSGGFGVFDAPEPWGPWTTVYYTTNWDVGPGETAHFPPKWMSANGKTVYLVFSGDDAFSVRKATLTTSSSSNAPPSVNLTEPTATSFLTGDPVSMKATASDPDGTVLQVEFLVDGSVVATDPSSPYTHTWSSTVSGSYSLAARATDDKGATATSGAVTITVSAPSPSPPSAPTGLSAAAVSSGRIDLSWTDTSWNETSFEIERSVGAGAFSPLATLGADSTSHIDTGLSPSTSYSYRVRAINSAGPSSWSNTASATTLSSGGGGGLVSNLSIPTYAVDILDVGKLQYVDRAYAFSTVPAAYVGMDYIQTANDDKSSQGFPWLTFDVSQDVTVTVAHDDRTGAKPAWMGGFVDTGDDLVSNGGGIFSIYARDFQAGTVALGGNIDGGTTGNSMYTVVVGPATGSGATDTDGDGLSDYDEINLYGTDPTLSDTDGDGTDDGTEVAQGTDPLDPLSYPGSGGGGSGSSSGGSGGCGATGWEALILLGLSAFRRRERPR